MYVQMQAVVVQMGCLAYEFYLLQNCNVAHMRLFSVFLALPSATVGYTLPAQAVQPCLRNSSAQ
jgi:hypothetical protein